MTWQALFGERATTKLVGIFQDEKAAVSIRERLTEKVGFRAEQLQIVSPGEENYDKKLEPETRGIARTAVRTHVILGFAGLVVGIVIWGALYATGWEAFRSSPGLAAIPILFFSIAGGMMIGGLVTARPDHEAVILNVRDAVAEGKWSLVIHPRNKTQCDQAEAMLNEATNDVWRSV